MECCICHNEIEKKYHDGKMYWDGGNNAEPVVEDGRCCDYCNATVVIPARIRGIQEREKGDERR